MPLLPYFHRTDLGALEDLVKTFLYPFPLGYALGLRWQAKGIGETPAYGGSILVGLALGGLLELAQLAVVSRSPDLTDVILCARGDLGKDVSVSSPSNLEGPNALSGREASGTALTGAGGVVTEGGSQAGSWQPELHRAGLTDAAMAV